MAMMAWTKLMEELETTLSMEVMMLIVLMVDQEMTKFLVEQVWTLSLEMKLLLKTKIQWALSSGMTNSSEGLTMI